MLTTWLRKHFANIHKLNLLNTISTIFLYIILYILGIGTNRNVNEQVKICNFYPLKMAKLMSKNYEVYEVTM